MRPSGGVGPVRVRGRQTSMFLLHPPSSFSSLLSAFFSCSSFIFYPQFPSFSSSFSSFRPKAKPSALVHGNYFMISIVYYTIYTILCICFIFCIHQIYMHVTFCTQVISHLCFGAFSYCLLLFCCILLKHITAISDIFTFIVCCPAITFLEFIPPPFF